VTFTGIWLHEGDWRGKDFTHELSEYDHDEHPGGQGSTKMRHALVEQEGRQVGIWVPVGWSDAQVKQALESNW